MAPLGLALTVHMGMQASMEPPLMDVHMNIPVWPGLISAVGILITRVSAVEVLSGNL